MTELRTCKLPNGEIAKFHMFYTAQYTCPPSLAIDGHPGGQMSVPQVLIERADGTIHTVAATNIQFRMVTQEITKDITIKLNNNDFTNENTIYLD